MTIEFDDVTDVLRRVRLTGRLDVPGTQAISIKFWGYQPLNPNAWW
jgi:hypothetical protein